MIGEAAVLAVDVSLPKGIHSSGGLRASRMSARSVRCRKRSSGAGSSKRWQMRCSDDWGSGMGWNSGWQRPAERSSAPAAWSRCPPRSSPIWAAPRDRKWRGRGIYRALTAGSCTISACAWQEADPQRLDRRIAPDPRTSGTSRLDHDALPAGRRWVAGSGDARCVAWASVLSLVRQSG